jgi:hypothetical protein
VIGGDRFGAGDSFRSIRLGLNRTTLVEKLRRKRVA